MNWLLKRMKELLAPTCVDCAGKGVRNVKYEFDHRFQGTVIRWTTCTLCRGTGKILDDE